MGQLKTNDFLCEVNKKGEYQRTLYPPHPSLIPNYAMVDGKRVQNGFKVAPKGYYQPSHVDGSNREIVEFGQHHARRFRHDKNKRRF